MKDSYPASVGMDWSKQLISKKAWESCNCYLVVGVNLSYWYWDNPDVLGSGIVALGYLAPTFRNHRPLSYSFQMGMGGAYNTKPYDAETNPDNQSYSLYVSVALMVGAGVKYRFSDSWTDRLMANYNHISNGGLQTPNKGLNYPTLQLGVYKSLQTPDYPTFEKVGKRQPPEQKSRIMAYHLSGWSNAQAGDRNLFYVFGLGMQYGKWLGARSAITVGTEYVADYSRKEQLSIAQSNTDYTQASALVGHAFWLGKVTFSQELGVYYYRPHLTTSQCYQRYGLTYTFFNRIPFGFNLKAHGHVADFFDFRVGYVF